jgi:hypothetical protein
MTFTVLQKRVVGPDRELRWIRVADGFKTAAEAAKVADRFRGWVWWGPSKAAGRIERGEEHVT